MLVGVELGASVAVCVGVKVVVGEDVEVGDGPGVGRGGRVAGLDEQFTQGHVIRRTARRDLDGGAGGLHGVRRSAQRTKGLAERSAYDGVLWVKGASAVQNWDGLGVGA